ncbi:hypothetical protein COUCH_11510 [Couchioplanes caeruleus]|uniref:hypothetical protein n=1 Tax=Couchioplanes caeruleus TaxID=56438 RepID=UPI0020C00D97|nr:hypothetical protein [Couchioplanes caeruleus]UQU66849.1 hypothetical protein COUCH_11510 [Couchioplanes caeruleus]
MGFFDAPAPRDPNHQQGRWDTDEGPWQRWQTVLPETVGLRLVIARTAAAVVAVTGLQVFPDGFVMTFTAVWRPAVGRRIHRAADAAWLGAAALPEEVLRLGVQFADDSKATNLDDERQTPASSAGPVMIGDGATGDSHRLESRYCVLPLPPAGALTFVCQWPVFGIPETHASLDATLIRDAATRAIGL